ncbi:hypothetical protein MKX03_008423, partial [Papaver bracteatum]
ICFLLVCEDAKMQDYGFEFSEDEPEEHDVDIENRYYNSNVLLEHTPHSNF